MKKFQEHIKAYLDERAANDPMFAKSYANEDKNIEDCCRYIIGEVFQKAIDIANGKAKSGAMPKEEVYSLAIHYYDESDIIIRPIKGTCKIFETDVDYKPTEEDIQKARKKAIERLQEEAYQELHCQKKKKVQGSQEEEKQQSEQTSLFD